MVLVLVPLLVGVMMMVVGYAYTDGFGGYPWVGMVTRNGALDSELKDLHKQRLQELLPHLVVETSLSDASSGES